MILHHDKYDNAAFWPSFVTRSPLNEDVFAAPSKDHVPVSHEEIKDLQAKIYKLFLQVIMLLNPEVASILLLSFV